MDDLKARLVCLKAATEIEGRGSAPSAEHLLRLAFAFECYAYGGFNCALDVLRNPPAIDQPAGLGQAIDPARSGPNDEPLPASSTVH